MKSIKRKAIARTAVAVLIVLVVVAAGGFGAYAAGLFNPKQSTNSSSCPASLKGTLNIAGSTLVFPLMSMWQFAFSQLCPDVIVNYNAIGSGGGISALTKRTVDIGATDAPLSSSQYAALPAPIVTIPESVSAVVPAYNIPGIGNGLNFTGDILARIFLGNITNWNDPAIKAINPNVPLPDHAIVVVHRSDGSGTMYAFTQFLSLSNQQWRKQVGYGLTLNWPTGVGCKGNEGVAGCIENTPYSIGPLEIAYVIQNPSLIHYGAVMNAAHRFILANLTNIAEAASEGASKGLPAGDAAWTSFSIINNIFNDTSAVNAYPITTFTYLITYKEQTDKNQGMLVVYFLWWVVNKAQNAGAKLGYAPLPPNVVALDDQTIKSITYNGSPLYSGP